MGMNLKKFLKIFKLGKSARIIFIISAPFFVALFLYFIYFSVEAGIVLNKTNYTTLINTNNKNIIDVLSRVIDLDLIRYNVEFKNNLYSDISGINHGVEIFISDNQGEELKITEYDQVIIFKEITNKEFISKIKELKYKININLKPEVLSENEIISFNSTSGKILLIKKPTYISVLWIYIFLLISLMAILIFLKEAIQFVVSGKNYFLK